LYEWRTDTEQTVEDRMKILEKRAQTSVASTPEQASAAPTALDGDGEQ
jgi:hypothetical protein